MRVAALEIIAYLDLADELRFFETELGRDSEFHRETVLARHGGGRRWHDEVLPRRSGPATRGITEPSQREHQLFGRSTVSTRTRRAPPSMAAM
jgi:hypothetical protein